MFKNYISLRERWWRRCKGGVKEVEEEWRRCKGGVRKE